MSTRQEEQFMKFGLSAFFVISFANCATISATQNLKVTDMKASLNEAATLLTLDANAFAKLCESTLANSKAQIAKLKSDVNHDNILVAYDDATASLSNMSARSGLAKEVHPDAAVREAAEKCEQQLESFNVEMSLDRGLYDALAKVDLSKQAPSTQFWMFKVLREFKRSGVDRDEATRQKVKSLNEELVKIGQSFSRNIRDDVRTVYATVAELEGLPADYIEGHPVKDGKVAITTNTPDYMPVMMYAKSVKLRENLWKTYRMRAFPSNESVLKELLQKRYELATLLGYKNWAAYITETKMVKTETAAREFIERGEKATKTRAQADMAMLLKRKQKDIPGATGLDPWEQTFYEDRVKAESFGFDSQALRNYFEYDNVKKGVMAITSQLFKIRYSKIEDAKVWHQEVETYDIFEGEERIGRIHLDMHPRDNKYKHAAQFGLTVGRKNRELPEAVLVCNFPRAGGLLAHSDVETYFHEFGHLLHEIFSGRQQWAGISGIKTEWDFVEAPSMLLQEWPLDEGALNVFARHHATGQTIPKSLIAQLKAAKDFGVGVDTRRQFFLAHVSLDFHSRTPGFDTATALSEAQEKFLPFRKEYVPGSHFELGFGHLEGYSAMYYTYLWSTVIAKDLLAQFKKQGMLNGDLATQYRKKVLEPGGSQEAGKLVKDFLGREYSFEAFENHLNSGAPVSP
jgi:thimet oligopeptidase